MNAVVAAWAPDPVVLIAVGLAGWAYGTGLRRLRGRGRSRAEVAAFFCGLAAVVAALASPLDHLATTSLSAHMTQHLLLVLVAAPLLVMGRPLLPVLMALRPALRRAARRLERRPAVAAGGRILSRPTVAWLLHVSVLWAWHAPGPYQAALGSEAIHALEHASFLGTAMLFWWVALEAEPRRRLARGTDVLYVLLGWMQSGALGALFTFASSPIYPLYAARAGAAAALADQQVAGLIMWIPAGVVYLGAASWMFVGWLRAAEADVRRAESATAGVAAAAERPGW